MIFYDFKAGLNQEECVQQLQLAFGDESPARATVFRWFKEFSRGRNFPQDEEHTGRPPSAWCYFISLFFLAHVKFTSSQTTTFPPSTDFTTTENSNTFATTFPSVASFATEDESTTLTAADSALPTSTVTNENNLNDATTEQPAFGRFESQRSRPSANQEIEQPQDSTNGNNGQSEEKNIAWKFTRGGNSQDIWSRPSQTNGYPQWQKEVSQPAPVQNPQPVQNAAGEANKNNEQQYVVWKPGQNNPPPGWTIEGIPEGWINAAPEGGNWGPPDSSQGGINSGGWNAAQWTNGQSSVNEDSQAEYQEDENSSNDNEASGWNNAANGGWVGPVNDAGGWTNPVAQQENGNIPPSTGWAPQNTNAPVQNGASPQNSNAPVQNGWAAPNQNPVPQNGWPAPNQNPVPPNGWATVVSNNPPPNSWPSQAVNVPTQNGWAPPAANAQPQNGWIPPAPNPQAQNGWPPGSGAPPSNQWKTQTNAPNAWKQAQPANAGAGWTQSQQPGNVWQTPPQQAGPAPQTPKVQPNTNVQWNQNAGNSWTGPQTAAKPNGNSGTWNSIPSGATTPWNNGQANVEAWNNGGSSPGIPDPSLSWKVYNEDTQTMENLDDNLGWKVVGDGGSNGWKLVDENGNVEWKIENINGEWKVTSADEVPKQTNVTSNNTEVSNSTTSANATAESSSTTPSPAGGWDDAKQGRYIVWKFSEDGKGEARVYNGGNSDPDVWTIGDNNQYWKEAVAANGANNAGPWPTNTKSAGTSGSSSQNNKNGSWNSGRSRQNPNKSRSGKGGANGNTQQNNKWKNQISGGTSQPNNGGWQTGNIASPKQQQGNSVVPQTGTASVGWQNGNNGPQTGNPQWQSNAPPATAHTTTWNNRGSTQQGVVSWQNQQPVGDWSVGQNQNAAQAGWQQGGTSVAGAGKSNVSNDQRSRARGRSKNRVRGGTSKTWKPSSNNNQNAGVSTGTTWSNANGGNPNTQPSPNPWNTQAQGGIVNAGNGLLSGWPINNNGGQNVPYIIIIKTPQVITSPGDNSNPWASQGNNKQKSSRIGASKPQANRRENGSWEMNRAGSSGWQWNPQGNRDGWKWNEGWMGSGGGFGGWVKDGNSMYTSWKPTKNNGNSGSSQRPANKRVGANGSKKNGSKMVFVFGSKKGSKGNKNQPTSGRSGKGKQVIIIDYTTGKKVPKTDENMKKDIETVIQALKSARPTGLKGSASVDTKSSTQN
ncbi:putative uncharacterized protein DDB_G0286901 [Parasteatoda tepidariorum]|uniref:putative uncharacterized protein DDB_G0286901 n=1 Tax=Parasteatoda tepidariorum TaxID=114398 RepID=UPI0039BC40B4